MLKIKINLDNNKSIGNNFLDAEGKANVMEVTFIAIVFTIAIHNRKALTFFLSYFKIWINYNMCTFWGVRIIILTQQKQAIRISKKLIFPLWCGCVWNLPTPLFQVFIQNTIRFLEQCEQTAAKQQNLLQSPCFILLLVTQTPLNSPSITPHIL